MAVRSVVHQLRRVLLSVKAHRLDVGTGLKCGPDIRVSRGVCLDIGHNVFIGPNTSFGVSVEIGDDVMIAAGASFVGGDHKIDHIDTVMRLSGRDDPKPVRINANVWIGHRAIILHGITLASGSVVAAGCVLTKDTEPNGIYGGNPGKLIRYRRV